MQGITRYACSQGSLVVPPAIEALLLHSPLKVHCAFIALIAEYCRFVQAGRHQ